MPYPWDQWDDLARFRTPPFLPSAVASPNGPQILQDYTTPVQAPEPPSSGPPAPVPSAPTPPAIDLPQRPGPSAVPTTGPAMDNLRMMLQREYDMAYKDKQPWWKTLLGAAGMMTVGRRNPGIRGLLEDYLMQSGDMRRLKAAKPAAVAQAQLEANELDDWRSGVGKDAQFEADLARAEASRAQKSLAEVKAEQARRPQSPKEQLFNTSDAIVGATPGGDARVLYKPSPRQSPGKENTYYDRDRGLLITKTPDGKVVKEQVATPRSDKPDAAQSRWEKTRFDQIERDYQNGLVEAEKEASRRIDKLGIAGSEEDKQRIYQELERRKKQLEVIYYSRIRAAGGSAPETGGQENTPEVNAQSVPAPKYTEEDVRAWARKAGKDEEAAVQSARAKGLI